MNDASSAIAIRQMAAGDWPMVREIYAQGIATGDATFATDPGQWQDFDTGRLPKPRLIAEKDDTIVGWASLSGVSDRCVYAGVAEASVYVSHSHQRQGLGSRLLLALIEQSEQAGIWTLQAGIFPENQASLTLFQAHGFRTLGRRERLGRTSDGRWRDVLLLERRSRVCGI